MRRCLSTVPCQLTNMLFRRLQIIITDRQLRQTCISDLIFIDFVSRKFENKKEWNECNFLDLSLV